MQKPYPVFMDEYLDPYFKGDNAERIYKFIQINLKKL